MEIDKIEAFDYMLHLFEEWRDSHEELKNKPLSKLTAMNCCFWLLLLRKMEAMTF